MGKEVIYEDWNSTELADDLVCNDKFVEDHNLTEEQINTVWQWDRSDLIGYAYDYLAQE